MSHDILRKRVAIVLWVVGLTFIAWQAVMIKINGDAAARINSNHNLALECSETGTWCWENPTLFRDISEVEDDSEVWYGSRFRSLLGHSAADFPDVWASFRKSVHPDDMAAVEESLRRHLWSKGTYPYSVDYRLKTAGGEWLWFSAKGRCEFTSSGKPIRMAGFITAMGRERAEKLLYLRIIGSSPLGIIICDEERRVSLWNDTMVKLTGYAASEVVGKLVEDFLLKEEQQAEHAKKYKEAVSSASSTNAVVWYPEKIAEIVCKDGKLKVTKITVRAVQYGNRYAFVAAVNEMEDHERNNESK